jgi:hypothetical protein
MPKIDIIVPHQLPQEEALQRLQGFTAELKNRFADKITLLEERWDETQGQFRFLVFGFSISARLIVRSNKVELAGDLPFAAALFKPRIEATIREHLIALLSKST